MAASLTNFSNGVGRTRTPVDRIQLPDGAQVEPCGKRGKVAVGPPAPAAPEPVDVISDSDADLAASAAAHLRKERNKFGECDDAHASFTRWTEAKKQREAAKMTARERYVRCTHFVPS